MRELFQILYGSVIPYHCLQFENQGQSPYRWKTYRHESEKELCSIDKSHMSVCVCDYSNEHGRLLSPSVLFFHEITLRQRIKIKTHHHKDIASCQLNTCDSVRGCDW